jgi:TonB-dependent SusC/RagA subfamily outer membrane receptor
MQFFYVKAGKKFPVFRKFIKIMRLTAIAWILFSVQMSASVYAQKTKLSLDVRNKSIREILFQIEDMSEFRFIYQSEKVNLNRKVSVKVRKQTVESILNRILTDEQVVYEITENNLILINPGEKKAVKDRVTEEILQQRITVTGTVTDHYGEVVIGAHVIEKGSANGITTDMDGRFTLQVEAGAVLQISYIGYVSQEIAVKDQRDFRITLTEDMQRLEEVVVVGYGTQKKVNLTGAVSSIGSGELTIAPVANTTNALAGKLPGLTVIQNSGQPGSDGAGLNIRGFADSLIIVDGIEASFHTIDPQMIESVSILKDASASIYGSRAGNGVILITTKRGVQQKPVITFSTNLTLQGITSMPRPTNAGQYAELEREKWLQSGRPAEQAPFTGDQIRRYYDGSDPQYPNTNWYDELIRAQAPQQQYNLSVRGGTESIRYYGFAGYLNQQSMWKKKRRGVRPL